MPFAGLRWAPKQLSFAAGLNQRTDDRARSESFFDICRDVQFDEMGGIQTRYPFAALSNSIFGGGTLSNCRRLAVVNDELCVFTDTALYSWNAQLAKWVLRGTHLAVDVAEQPRFVTQDDQYDSDCAELNGTIVYVWTVGTSAPNSYVTAIDKTTGAMLMPPTILAGGERHRLVALDTKILLFGYGGNLLAVRALDPADPATGVASAPTTVLAAVADRYYDVVKAGTQNAAVGAVRRTTATSYTVFSVSASLSTTVATKARTCDGPIAVATIPDGTQTQVIRGNGTSIQGDLLTTSGFVDVFTAQAIGTAASTTINQIAVAFSSTTSARAFWTSGNSGENTGVTDFEVKTNTATTANVVGTQASFRQRLGIASRAFTYGGHVYVWLTFAQDSGVSVTGNASAIRAQLQNTYFLYRDDNFVVSQCARQVGGGFNASTGRLTGVALVSGTTQFAWCPSVRRRIEVGGSDHSSFEARSPLEVVFTFDSNTARRTASLGRTLYITGGIPMQYDGVQLAEVGFLVYPWYFEPQQGGAGNLAAGTYTWKSTLRWPNAQGEVDRSTTATGMSVAIAASKFAILNHVYHNVTLKVSPRPIALDFWRTPKDVSEPMYRVNSVDPTALPGANNGYVTNDDTLASSGVPLPDNYADATLITKEKDPETGDILEHLAPPGARIVIPTATRLMLAGITGSPHSVAPSRERPDDEVASFHEELVFDAPRPGGDLTAIAFLDQTLVVFREAAIYAFAGPGLDNREQGRQWELVRTISSDLGAESQEAVALTPYGLLFKSRKGWHLLDGGGNLRYVGAPVSDFDSDAVLAIDVMETQHHVRILTASRMIVWNYPRGGEDPGQWGEWTISDGLHSVVWNGTHVYLTSTGPKQQQTSYSSLTYGIDVETAWIKPADLLQGGAASRALQPLGEYRSSHLLRSRIAYNYLQSYVDDKVWTPSPTTVGGPLQFKHGPRRPRHQAIKMRLTAVTDAARALLFADLSGTLVVNTSGTRWAATLQAVPPGELGNLVTLSLAFVDGVTGTFSIDVRDHFVYTSGAWAPAVNTIGVLITMTASSRPTTTQLEAAITAGTALATVAIPDSSKTIAASMIGTTVSDHCTGGAFGSPTGEALKLTGLGLEVGVEAPLYNRLPASQKL